MFFVFLSEALVPWSILAHRSEPFSPVVPFTRFFTTARRFAENLHIMPRLRHLAVWLVPPLFQSQCSSLQTYSPTIVFIALVWSVGAVCDMLLRDTEISHAPPRYRLHYATDFRHHFPRSSCPLRLATFARRPPRHLAPPSRPVTLPLHPVFKSVFSFHVVLLALYLLCTP